jgi:hypothetical protein
MTKFVMLAMLVLAAIVAAWLFWRPTSQPEVTIGVEGRRTITFAGPLLRAAPFTPGDALAVRIAGTQPSADGYEYDLRYMAFGPGELDLGKSLVGPAGNPPPTRPELVVSIPALIPESYSGELYRTANSSIDLHTNYRFYMTLSWIVWALLLIPLIYFSRDWTLRTTTLPPEPSIPERLRLLLARAAAKKLSAVEQADLEQLLLAFWSQRLHLEEQRLSDTIQQLRQHPQASEQWSRVEQWLHARAVSGQDVPVNLLRELDALA